ncbi:MAG TPA: hypothetical protein VFE63_17730 [Roseiarcus sp.]|jgi:hypothetical protein|nr:hypothetical protein [Roseiarcus sp.]
MIRRNARRGRGQGRVPVILLSFCLLLFSGGESSANLAVEGTVGPGEPRAAVRYVLPITPPLDQGDSDLCWVYATLSMLETNYLARHPLSRISLSRGALQLDSIADRFARLIRGERSPLEDGGLVVEALALIHQDGLVARGDFHHIVDSDPIYASVKRGLTRYKGRTAKLRALDRELEARLGRKPQVTHLDGDALSPGELAEAVLGGHEWTEFDRSHDGFDGWGPSRDPDARPDTLVRYVGLERMIDLIHRSLAHGRAVAAGSADHEFLIYGGDYDKDGRPISYLIKDSLAPHLYRAEADKIHRMLYDVTVAQ